MICLLFSRCWATTHWIKACLNCIYSQNGFHKCKTLVFLPLWFFEVLTIQLQLLHLTFNEYFYPKYSKNLIRTLRFKLQDSPDRIELLMLAINHPLRGIIMLSIVEEFYLVYLGIKRILDIPSNIVTI